MRDLITLNSKVIELNDVSPNTREVVMYVHTIDEENANGLDFTMSSTQKYKDTLINKPVVVKMDTSESDFKGHEPMFDSSGKIVKLDTIAIGTITETWIEDKETKKALMAKATIWSYKFPTAIEIMQNLFSEGNLDTSVEVAIFSYSEDSTPSHRKTEEIEYLSNCLLGSLILPADSNAGVVEMFYKEVAQALKQDKLDDSNLDIQTKQEGGQDMAKKKEVKTEVFNKGVEIRYHGQIENCQISFEDISNAIYHQVNYDSEENYVGGYCVCDTFLDHVIVRSWEDDDYFSVNYSIVNDEVTIDSQDKWIQGDMVFTPNGQVGTEDNDADDMSTNPMMMEKDAKIEELNKQIKKLNTDLETAQKELSTKDEALKTTETESNEKIIKLGESIDGLKIKLAEVEPVVAEYNKVQAELAEKAKAEKIEEMKKFALNSKVITEKEIAEDETIKQIINELNEVNLKSLIADRIVEANAKEIKVEVAGKDKDITIVVATEGEDLISKSLKDKYLS